MNSFKKKSLVSSLALVAGLAMGASAQAADWSSTSMLLLDGAGYKNVPADTKFNTQVLTLEHVDGWKYGSNFFFFDVTNPNSAGKAFNDTSADGVSSFYGEFSPSLSLSKMTGKDMSFGFVKDVSIAGTWELGQNTNALLAGVGFALDIPGVPVASLTLYQRTSTSKFAPGKTGSGQQATIVWMSPFNVGPTSWTFEGYLDYATEEKDVNKVENIVASPRLTMDVGSFFGAPKKVSVGVEYSYWHNKYGSKGIDEGVPQAAVKWTF
ncbi:outer membrane protein OmpK [Thiosulfativibrio zosterae]|uniref:Membrane protein n=1 Tax=Thiosulfativibrio zosterae TaxID=2675053 RepID=A0A6F8PPD8_9GAMM|nr:outer membrane protein OmpK [Thiosulfativibrio zosterae]BBP43907.1 membrane protein [Thiosulfativibrio zosterae]